MRATLLTLLPMAVQANKRDLSVKSAHHLIVAGIGTLVGKTLVSAAICERFGADYWKPVFTGCNEGPRDTERVASLISDGATRVHPERYLFQHALSPHVAAAIEHRTISIDDIRAPSTERKLVIEMAGGLMVPLNDDHTNVDLIAKLDAPLVLVSRHYLGSINHTLLSIECLRARGVPILGVIFNGVPLPDTERIIEKFAQVPVLAHLPELPQINAATLSGVVREWSSWW